MSDLSATVNPTVKTIRKEVERYRRLVRAHLLAYGGSWGSITPSRKSKSPYARFRWLSDRIDTLMALPPSSDRDEALRVVHTSLWREAMGIDDE